MEIVNLGPECFTTTNGIVINYKGENYYKACGAPVRALEDGGMSHCVKPSGHPRNEHEDYDGDTRIDDTPEISDPETA